MNITPFLLSNATTFHSTNHTTITDTLVLTAMTFEVSYWTEYTLTEKTITLRLVCAVVDSLWLEDFAT
jgi:hypothetical protein